MSFPNEENISDRISDFRRRGAARRGGVLRNEVSPTRSVVRMAVLSVFRSELRPTSRRH